jgi:predicted amidohydrolase
MRAGLVVPRLLPDAAANLRTMERMAAEAVTCGASLILFPEAVLTGLIDNDDPAHEMPLGQTIPGPATDRLGAFCLRHGVWLGLGLIERQGSRLYDSAVLLRPDGSIALTYRRNRPQWHGKSADRNFYCEGSEIGMAKTPFGSAAFLVCGDLFDDQIVLRFRNLGADWLLFPFARSFSDGTVDQARWDMEELPEYLQRIRMTQTPALMVNYLANGSLHDDRSFGGAYVVSAQGEVVAQQPLGVEGILVVDMEEALNKAVEVTLSQRA